MDKVNSQSTSIIGREDELEFLQGCLGTALTGKGLIIFITGEAGIGKSRLIQEAKNFACNMGFECYSGKSDVDLSSPYLPFRDILDEITASQGNSTKSVDAIIKRCDQLQSSVGNRQEHNSSDISGIQLTYWNIFRKLSEIGPLLLILEDLQWADSLSTNLLYFLGRNIKHSRIVIIASYRIDSKFQGGENDPSSIMEVSDALNREQTCKMVSLKPLELEGVNGIIKVMLHGPPDIELVRIISGQSAGNPLYVIEIVKLLIETNALVERKGVWRWNKQIEIEVPSTIKGIIQRRLINVPPKETYLLECASVVGIVFNRNVVEEVVFDDIPRKVSSWEKLEYGYDLIWNEEETSGFKHGLIHKVVYDNIPEIRRKGIHLSIAEHIEKNNDIYSNLERLANHFHDAGVSVKWVPYAISAGEKCFNLCAYKEAVKFYRMALESEEEPVIQNIGAVYEGLGDCYRELVDLKKARACYDWLLLNDPNPGTRARILRKYAESSFPTGDDEKIWRNRIEILKEAEALDGVSTLDRAEIKTTLAQTYQEVGDVEKAQMLYDEAIVLFSDCNAPNRFALTLHCKSCLYIQLGKIEEARLTMARAFDLIKNCPTPLVELELTITMGEIEMILGKYADAILKFTRAEELANQIGHNSEAGWAHAYHAMIYFDVQNFERAYEEAQNSLNHTLLLDIAYSPLGPLCLMTLINIELENMDESYRQLMNLESMVPLIPLDVNTPNVGLELFVEGYYWGRVGDIEKCSDFFNRGFTVLEGKRLGLFYGALGHEWYAGLLRINSRYSDSEIQYNIALEIFSMLGNTLHVNRINGLRLLC